jgi:SAM-dependent methyltransferase
MAASMDSQLAFGEAYAYNQNAFAEFYDLMVASLPPEYEVGKDLELYAMLARQRPGGVAIDLCTGTGRVLDHILKAGSASAVVGVDHSSAMLDAARRRLGDDSVRLICKSMQAPSLPSDIQLKADLVILSAGSIHHLTTRSEQISTLCNIRALLSDSSTALAVISLLCDGDCLGEEDPPAMKLGPFEWQQTARYVADVAEPVKQLGSVFKAQICTTEHELKQGARVQHQKWSMRTVSTREELHELCDVAGLQVTHAFESFANALNGVVTDGGNMPKLVYAGIKP